MIRKPMKLKQTSTPKQFCCGPTSSEQTELITPIIRTGVNPFDGSENDIDTNYAIAKVAAEYMADHSTSNPSKIVVGERREVLTSIFYNRAFSLFYTSLNIVNNNCKILLANTIPLKFKNQQCDEYGYIRDNDWFTFYDIMNSHIGAPYSSIDKKYPAISQVNGSNNRLLDLTYYVQLPENAVFECILDYMSCNALANTRNLTSMQLTADEYALAQEVLFKGTLNAISVMESIVSVLYKEANTMYKLGYNGRSAIDYLSAKRVSENAVVDAAYDTTKAICAEMNESCRDEF